MRGIRWRCSPPRQTLRAASSSTANLRRRRFLRLMLDAPVRKLVSHLQAAEDTRGYAIKEGGGRVAPAHRMIISHNLVEPIGAIGVAGSNPHCSRDMLQRGRALLQLGRRRRPSVPLVVAAAIVDLLASGRNQLVGALLPRAALLGLRSLHVSPEHVHETKPLCERRPLCRGGENHRG